MCLRASDSQLLGGAAYDLDAHHAAPAVQLIPAPAAVTLSGGSLVLLAAVVVLLLVLLSR